VVAGFGINILMLGLPALLSGAMYDSAGSTEQIAKENLLPDFFGINIASFLAFLLVPICWYVLYKTPFGLRLRAVGENPAAADAAGVSVIKLRYTAVILSGVLAAAGGAYLSIGQSSLFTRGMTAGRGFIALAALILAKWRPVQVMFACLFFGFTEALTIPLANIKMASGENVPVQFIQIIPYVLTIIVLAGFIGLSRAPKALGIPYRKEK
jgi:simple sugar transport system permease protein